MNAAEENAQRRALRQYRDWLIRRFQRLDVVELSDQTEAADPISLREIYVPVRLDAEDLSDDNAFKDENGNFLEPEKEKLPGADAFDVLAKKHLVLVSGRPGSGKTTFVHAAVVALADREAGKLRRELGAVPVPFILRRLDRPDKIRGLDDLFNAWWPEVEKQAEKDGLALDRDRLEAILRPTDQKHLDQQPVLLMFDGIDEVGGPETRQRILEVVFEAISHGYKALVTGRPTGFMNLSFPGNYSFKSESRRLVPIELAHDRTRLISLPPELGQILHHIQPFAWPQVTAFIKKWYALRDDWRADADQGIRHFLAHLSEPGRRSLLVLARRPIFLALMALVNCTENRMPEGRAKLYERIVELYLGRQERFRQRKAFTDGSPMPRWTPDETRRVLAAVAAVSMEKGSEQSSADKRRFLWQRDDLEAAVRDVLENARFPTLRPDDATTLVKFFLNPAGLLVEPSEGEIQFAHLSFQEYLCAVHFYEQAKQWEDGVPHYSETELFPLLGRPGWQEVGMLYLCVHSHATGQQGHLVLLKRLDPTDRHQAGLYVAALTGRELEFAEQERQERLPVGLMCALLHPSQSLGEQLRRWPDWAEDGLGWMLRLLEAPSDQEQWSRLEEGVGDLLRSLEHAQSTWLDSKADTKASSLVQLVADAGWGLQEDIIQPIVSENLEIGLANYVKQYCEKGSLWLRDNSKLSRPTVLALELDRLVSSSGELHRQVSKRIPLETTWLQGDAPNSDHQTIFDVNSQPSVLLLFHIRASTPASRITIVVQQGAILCKLLGSHLKSISLALSRAISLTRSLVHPRPFYNPHSHSLYRSLYRSFNIYHSRSLPLPRSPHHLLSLFSQPRSRPHSSSLNLSLFLPLKSLTQKRFERWFDLSDDDVNTALTPLNALVLFGLRSSAYEWFDIQASDPDLTRRRGLLPGQPLPQEFSIFDAEGRPKTVQRRESIEALRAWIADPDQVLDWTFRQEAFDGDLDPKTRAHFQEEINLLNSQPWGATAYFDAVLADWPEDQEEMDVSVEAAERRLVEALDEAEKAP